jgi:hypothetical protein
MLPGSSRADLIVCPNEDLAGRALGDQSFGTTIFCSYGLNVNCIYNATTGDLEVDNDGGDCPAEAVVFTGAPTGTPSGAPAMTRWGLLAAAGMLAGIAGIALRRRRG